MRSFRSLFTLFLLIAITVVGANPTHAYAPKSQIKGTFVLWQGDRPVPRGLQPVSPRAGIYVDGIYHELPMDTLPISLREAMTLNGKQVVVAADGIQPQSTIPDPDRSYAGPRPRATLLCGASDSSTPRPYPVSYYNGLYRASYPSLEHYWETMSNHAIYGLGPSVFGWYTLPGKINDYMMNGSADLDRIFAVCAQLADRDVMFPDYVGIDIMVDFDLGAAWSGPILLTIDGQTKTYEALWYPPYDDPLNFLTHEQGHNMGRQHSCGSGVPCDEYQDYTTQMSALQLKCDVVRDPIYGCIPFYMDSFDLYELGWMTRLATAEESYTQVQLEPLYALSNQKRALFIPIEDSQFVTVEYRTLISYDAKLPTAGLNLHMADVNANPQTTFLNVARNGDDVSKAAFLTRAGQVYKDPQGRFTVCVLSTTGGVFTVAAGIGYDCTNGPPPATATPTATRTPSPTRTATPTQTPSATPATPSVTPTTMRRVYLPMANHLVPRHAHI